jgi:hypothetical protein
VHSGFVEIDATDFGLSFLRSLRKVFQVVVADEAGIHT